MRHLGGVVDAIGKFVRDNPSVSYGISSRPHPFISILRSAPVASWPFVLEQILASGDSLPTLKPVISFILLDPHCHDHFAPLRSSLINHLLQTAPAHKEMKSMLKTLVPFLLQNTKDIGRFREHSEHVIRISQLFRTDITISFLPFLSSLVLQSHQHGLSSDFVLAEVNTLIQRRQPTDEEAEVCSVILAKVFKYLRADETEHLLRIIFLLLRDCSVHVLWQLILSSLIPSLAYAKELQKSLCLLIHEAMAKAKDHSSVLDASPRSKTDFIFDAEVLEAVTVMPLLRFLSSSEENVHYWLDRLPVVDGNETVGQILLALALYQKENHSIPVKVLDILATCKARTNHLTLSMLTLIIFKLSSFSLSGDSQVEHVRYLPKLAEDRTSVSLVLNVLKPLSACKNLQPLKVSLLCDLWKAEDRVYPVLRRALEEKCSQDLTYSINLTTAIVIREICRLEPKRHGADLLPTINKFLNDCIDYHEAVICKVALDCIHHLCQNGVMDIRTTLQALSGRMLYDHRLPVVESFVHLYSLVPSFAMKKSTEYEEFRHSTLRELFSLLDSLEDIRVRKTILQTIASFSIEDFDLAMLPRFAKKNLKYPPGFIPRESGGKPVPCPEEVLTFIPGSCWVEMVLEAPQEFVPSYQNIFVSLLEAEISSLPRGVYHVNPTPSNKGREPPNYNHLDETTLLRATVAHLLALALKKHRPSPRDHFFVKSLSRDRPRLLPPLDWGFMTQIGQIDLGADVTTDLFAIVAKQMAFSR